MIENGPTPPAGEASLKSMVNRFATRLEPLGAEALRGGLSAFISPSQITEVEAVPLEMIELGRESYRIKPDEEVDLAALTEAMRLRGFTSILVGRRKASKVEVAFGERRLKAAAIAGLKTIPVLIRDWEDKTFLELGVTENFLFASLSPLEEANLFKGLLDQAAYSPEALANIINRPPGYLEDRLALIKYSEVKEALALRQINSATALELARVESQILRGKMLRQAVGQGFNKDLPARFIITTIGGAPNAPGPENLSLEPQQPVPPKLWGSSGSSKKKAVRKEVRKQGPTIENQFETLEGIISSFRREYRSLNLELLLQEDGLRRKGMALEGNNYFGGSHQGVDG